MLRSLPDKQIDGFDNVAVRITMTLFAATQEPHDAAVTGH